MRGVFWPVARAAAGPRQPRRCPTSPLMGLRSTAHHLTQAWNTVPHVVQYDRADITAIETLRKRLSKKSEAEGRSPVTITAFLMKTLAAALMKFPQVNS